jgi:hypothetical protein
MICDIERTEQLEKIRLFNLVPAYSEQHDQKVNAMVMLATERRHQGECNGSC